MKTSNRILLIVTALLLVAGAAMLGYLAGIRLTASPPSVPLEDVLDTARDPEWLAIEAPDAEFEALDGSVVRLADFRGQIVVLNFWGTWCAPCVYEIPELVKLQTKLEELGGTVLGPAIDSGSSEKIRAFLSEYEINYPIVKGTNRQAVGDFGAMGYPFTLLIDAEGVIRRRYLGPQTAEGLLEDVMRLLSENGSGNARRAVRAGAVAS